MIIAGIIITLLGFLISVGSVGVASSTTARLGIVLVGIAVSLGGIIGVLNRAYLGKAIWRKYHEKNISSPIEFIFVSGAPRARTDAGSSGARHAHCRSFSPLPRLLPSRSPTRT